MSHRYQEEIRQEDEKVSLRRNMATRIVYLASKVRGSGSRICQPQGQQLMNYPKKVAGLQK